MDILIFSLGGSVIVPDRIDYAFLEKFKKLILKLARKKKIVICTGGGKTARNYINALGKAEVSNLNKDITGIAATRLNAVLVSSFLINNAVIPTTLVGVKEMLRKRKIVICGGLKPGITTDGTTAAIARYLNAKFFINLA